MGTFGYTSIGGNTFTVAPNRVVACYFTAPENATVTQLSFYISGLASTVTDKVTVGLYERNDSIGFLGTALWASGAFGFINIASGWKHFPYSSSPNGYSQPVIEEGKNYFFLIQNLCPHDIYVRYNTGGAATQLWYNDGNVFLDYILSSYATYEIISIKDFDVDSVSRIKKSQSLFKDSYSKIIAIHNLPVTSKSVIKTLSNDSSKNSASRIKTVGNQLNVDSSSRIKHIISLDYNSLSRIKSLGSQLNSQSVTRIKRIESLNLDSSSIIIKSIGLTYNSDSRIKSLGDVFKSSTSRIQHIKQITLNSSSRTLQTNQTDIDSISRTKKLGSNISSDSYSSVVYQKTFNIESNSRIDPKPLINNKIIYETIDVYETPIITTTSSYVSGIVETNIIGKIKVVFLNFGDKPLKYKIEATDDELNWKTLIIDEKVEPYVFAYECFNSVYPKIRVSVADYDNGEHTDVGVYVAGKSKPILIEGADNHFIHKSISRIKRLESFNVESLSVTKKLGNQLNSQSKSITKVLGKQLNKSSNSRILNVYNVNKNSASRVKTLSNKLTVQSKSTTKVLGKQLNKQSFSRIKIVSTDQTINSNSRIKTIGNQVLNQSISCIKQLGNQFTAQSKSTVKQVYSLMTDSISRTKTVGNSIDLSSQSTTKNTYTINTTSNSTIKILDTYRVVLNCIANDIYILKGYVYDRIPKDRTYYNKYKLFDNQVTNDNYISETVDVRLLREVKISLFNLGSQPLKYKIEVADEEDKWVTLVNGEEIGVDGKIYEYFTYPYFKVKVSIANNIIGQDSKVQGYVVGRRKPKLDFSGGQVIHGIVKDKIYINGKV